MRMTGLKTIAMAVGLALAGVAQAAPAPQAAIPEPATGQQATATTAAAADAAKAQVATPASTDPSLVLDGGPNVLPQPGIGQPIDGALVIQKQFTKTGERALWFHDYILFPVITAISIFVLILLVIVVARFRQSVNKTPTKTAHNTTLEVAWTLLPVVILAAIAAPSIGLLQAQYKPAPKNAVTLKAIGNQWYWTYEYPDHGGIQLTSNMLKERDDPTRGKAAARTDADGPRLLAVDQRVVLPVGVPIRLITTSNDVIHSWSIPAFWVKLDAIPGRLNETSFTIEKPGVYFGVCSELCGARHGFMPISVVAVPPAQFAAWVKAKGGSLPGAAPAPAVLATPAASGAPAAAVAGPVQNATAAAPATNQAATANPAGAGNTDH